MPMTVCTRPDSASIHANVRLHSEVPLVALPGLMHPGVVLALRVPGRTGRGHERGIHQRACLEHEPLRCQVGVDRWDLLGQGIEPQHLRLLMLLVRHARHLACGSLHAPVSGGVLQTFPMAIPS
ncbi:hypothetical protein I4I83_11210 [Acidovorax cattleyae]|nr:hypothetical protein [Paracidovorax cattleyae]